MTEKTSSPLTVIWRGKDNGFRVYSASAFELRREMDRPMISIVVTGASYNNSPLIIDLHEGLCVILVGDKPLAEVRVEEMLVTGYEGFELPRVSA